MLKLIKISIYILLLTPLSLAYAGTSEGGGGPHARAFYKNINQKIEIPNRDLNLVLRNGLYKAKVSKQPSSKLRLFDSCIKGNHVESISKVPRTYCVDWFEEAIASNDGTVQKLTCRKWSKIMSLRNARKYAKRNPKECKMVKGAEHPNVSFYGNRPSELVPLCDYHVPISKVKKTQGIEVYQMNEFTTDSVYFSATNEDKAQPGYSRFKYTIPNCSE